LSIEETILKKYAEEPLTRQLMQDLLREYKRPNDKINEMIRAGKLTAVKKGFYIPGPKLDMAKPRSFLIANHLYGPSYVSMESALSYWGLIPEKVYETSSVTIKRGRFYKTPVGRFRYFHAGLPYYSYGLKSVKLTERQVAIMASPEKAICDKIIMTPGILFRSTQGVKEFLTEDLRIEKDSLLQLDLESIESWIEHAPKKTSIEMLVKTLERL
jgi:hypothetical protein